MLETPAAANAEALRLQSGSPGIDGAKAIEKFIENKWRFLRKQEKLQLDKDALKFRLPDGGNKINPNPLPLNLQLPPRPIREN